jgi:hypothetical protein
MRRCSGGGVCVCVGGGVGGVGSESCPRRLVPPVASRRLHPEQPEPPKFASLRNGRNSFARTLGQRGFGRVVAVNCTCGSIFNRRLYLWECEIRPRGSDEHPPLILASVFFPTSCTHDRPLPLLFFSLCFSSLHSFVFSWLFLAFFWLCFPISRGITAQ